MPWTVIPANAGIQIFRMLLDPCFRGSDDGDQFFNGLLGGQRPAVCGAGAPVGKWGRCMHAKKGNCPRCDSNACPLDQEFSETVRTCPACCIL